VVAPADWKEIKVGEYAHITTGKKNTQDRMADGKYPFFVRSQNVERINSYSYDGEAVLTAGDGVGTGKVFHYINGKFDCHQRVYRITDFRSDLDGKFFYLLFSRLFYDRIMSMTAKSSVDSVRMEMISEMKLVVPSSIREQEAIAEALSDADEAIESLGALIAKKRDVKQAAMQQLLTGRTRLPGFTADWKEVRLSEIAEVDPENLSATTSPHYEFKYISLENVSKGRLVGFTTQVFQTAPSRARRILKDLDVLLATVRPNLLGHLLFRGDSNWIGSTGFAVVRCKSDVYSSAFMSQVVFSYVIQAQIELLITGSNYPAINSKDVRELRVPLPPLNEQEAIAEALTVMDDELEALNEQVLKLRMVKEGMMQDLLTGKVRLV
jgi:type I restriction enzyme, S subunit